MSRFRWRLLIINRQQQWDHFHPYFQGNHSLESVLGQNVSQAVHADSAPQTCPPQTLEHNQVQNTTLSTAGQLAYPAPNHPKSTTLQTATNSVIQSLPFSNSSSADCDIQTKSSEEAKEAFIRLFPLLKTVNSGNFGQYLIEVLKECHDDVPLNDFFHIIYNGDPSKDMCMQKDDEAAGIDRTPSQERLKGIKLQYLVLESFKNSNTALNRLLLNSRLSTVTFHELSRNFLAIKILLGCIKKVDDHSQTLPRLSIYKVYYMICRKLSHKVQDIPSFVFSAKHHILAQPKLGVLTKLLYPDLVWKRLGKRGQSKAHYIGLTWNTSMVDDDIIGLLDLNIIDLTKHFDSMSNAGDQVPKRRRTAKSQEKVKPVSVNSDITPTSLLSPKKPLYSFVNLSSKYPDWDTSPRVWKVAPNSVPKHSVWAKATMERSMEVLGGYGVSFYRLSENVAKGVFHSDDHSSISETVIQSINVLLRASCPKEIFLHLYLAVILLLFPVILASDQEVSKDSKIQLRVSVNACVRKLESEFTNDSSIDKTSLVIFTRALRNMIHINEMTSSRVQASHTKRIFKEVVGDLQSVICRFESSNDLSCFEEMFVKGVIKAINAYSCDLTDSSAPTITSTSPSPYPTSLLSIGKALQQVLLIASSTMSQLSCLTQEDETDGDVPFQVFRLSAELFHELTLSYPEIVRLPIPIISFLMQHHTSEMQNISFSRFSRRGTDLCSGTFKTWWIFSAMFQEYMSVISEVVALSAALA
ncbi:hypothetical protein JCM33374_g1988 [Metschnikowia sp. JCM 33374]|nr:hypothetical protein JCM33374_g1988 [Metschnikowia sp. JCM 33374]